MLSGTDLTLLRGDRCLFRGLDFALEAGELMWIEGPNGCGKTSLLRGIGGLLEFETGQVGWEGRDVTADLQAFREHLVWLSHRTGLKQDLTLLENLRFEVSLRASVPERLPEVIERLGLGRLTGLPLRYLSAGQQRRVALARMLLSAGPLWLMDEPFTNLDKAGQALVAELVAEHVAGGGLCVAASHQDVPIDVPVNRVTLT